MSFSPGGVPCSVTLSSSGCLAIVSSESCWPYILWGGGVQFLSVARAAALPKATTPVMATASADLKSLFMVSPYC